MWFKEGEAMNLGLPALTLTQNKMKVYCKKAFHQFKVGDEMNLMDSNANELIGLGYVTATKPKPKPKKKANGNKSKKVTNGD